MTTHRKFLDRNEESKVKEVDASCREKWSWKWVEKSVDGTLVSECIRKIAEPGKVYCMWCDCEIQYGKGGWRVLRQHMQKKKHRENAELRKTNYRISAEAAPSTSTDTSTYGMHPFFKPKAQPSAAPIQAKVPLVDRKANQEAMLLAFMAEKSLPFTMAPDLIDLSKALSSDQKVLNELSMDRNTASYKMRFGLAKTMEDELIADLQKNKFSMNIDEATSDNNKKVLSVLVSYFSDKAGKVVIRHLASMSLTVVNSENLRNKMDNLLKRNNIPWTNCVSILMDSCNVMRGCKSGLETRLRGKQAPHLVDVDGDTCHHVHNAAKRFSKEFDNYLECMFSSIYTDFKWSPDLRDYLEELCIILGIKFTVPERYVPTRWLSVYGVGVDTLRLFDVFTLFYYSFLPASDRTHFLHLCVEIYIRKGLGSKTRDAVRDIQSKLRVKNMTKDGENRKDRITTKLFVTRTYTKLLLHFYASVLPLLKNFVLCFQKKETQIHKLHDKIVDLTKTFLACYIKPEVLQQSDKKLKTMDVTEKSSLLMLDDIFIGPKAEAILAKEKKREVRQDFLTRALNAYTATAKCLQDKLPLANKFLMHVSALDPLVRGHTQAQRYMKALPSLLTNVLKEDELEKYMLEVQHYNMAKLPNPTPETKIDEWWVERACRYPTIWVVVKAVVSCFHGPSVESSFSIMGNVITSQTASIGIKTFASIQTVKYTLQASQKSAVQQFKRKDLLHDPVSPALVKNMKTAYKRYATELEDLKTEKEAKRAKLNLKKSKVVAKRKAKELNLLAAQKARNAHREAMRRKHKKATKKQQPQKKAKH
ncbi:uncharacterized protein LOC105444695 [Strongylocentrotus purpuratus]|uniref:HAT C-terminal dimerisation domain-containing protein n=1 Tax=Strongylocentrotus purpuratus TaxID=7668 RepID=A0A7M7HHN8_STRPU|nr:uncharacterized protein LOC105444695 [Strongylocentrotus purpuratus]